MWHHGVKTFSPDSLKKICWWEKETNEKYGKIRITHIDIYITKFYNIVILNILKLTSLILKTFLYHLDLNMSKLVLNYTLNINLNKFDSWIYYTF